MTEQRKIGDWTLKRRFKHEFPGAITEVRVDDVELPDGSSSRFVTAVVGRSAMVVPIDDEGNTYLVRQFRYAVEKESVEAAAGLVDDGEGPLDAARRELREELGIEADDWDHLGSFHPIASLVETQVDAFLARGLRFVEQNLDRGEKIDILKVPLEEAEAMAADGRIFVPTSIAAIYLAARKLRAAP